MATGAVATDATAGNPGFCIPHKPALVAGLCYPHSVCKKSQISPILTPMDIWRSLGWGIVVYAIMYLAWSGMVIYGLSLGIISLIARLSVLALVTVIAARAMRLGDPKDVVGNALVWAATAIGLDMVFIVPFSGWALYASWSVWAGYALIVVFPLAYTMLRNRRG